MKKRTEGKVYDTETAKLVGVGIHYSNRGDLDYVEECLYVKKTGEYFIYGEGGARSKYSRQTGNNSWSGGEDIIPMTYEKAKKYAEENLTADEYEKEFGAESEAEDVHIHVQLAPDVAQMLKDGAIAKNQSLRDYISDLIVKANR